MTSDKFVDETNVIVAEYQASQDQTDRVKNGKIARFSHNSTCYNDPLGNGTDLAILSVDSVRPPQWQPNDLGLDIIDPDTHVSNTESSPLTLQNDLMPHDSHGPRYESNPDRSEQINCRAFCHSTPDKQTCQHGNVYSHLGHPTEAGTSANAGARALLSMRCQSAGQNSGSGADAVSPSLSPLSPGFSEWPPALPSQSLQLLGMSPKPLTSEDARFLRLFSAEVGQWMDLSDLSQTFSRKICRLAMHDPLLKAAIIACAAKQQYLTGRLFDGMLIARKNYNTAISLLIDRLQESEQPFAGFGFAATVICSCYEMLDATGRDWQKHLDGVFSFSQVRSVNGSSGGIEQAGFWSIARQEVVCSIINKSRLRLDPDLWAVDLVRIGQEGCEDLMNNQ